MSATDQLTQAMTDGRVPFSEDDLANRFSTEHADDLRYCEAWKRWLVWDQSRWRPDVTVRIFGLAREVCIASAATIAAVERLARSDLRHAAVVEQWDANQEIFNSKE